MKFLWFRVIKTKRNIGAFLFLNQQRIFSQVIDYQLKYLNKEVGAKAISNGCF